MRTLGVVCGGSGSSKFAIALSDHLDSISRDGENDWTIGFVPNVADNFWHSGLYVCPDVDILTYALAKQLDQDRGWGIQSDQDKVLSRYEKLGDGETWFHLGDLDLALSLRRTKLLGKGWKLSSVTSTFCRALGIKHAIVPPTDDFVQTFVRTSAGEMHLQEFWVKNKANVKVLEILYQGMNAARTNSMALRLLEDIVVICPANPITSILPTLSLPKVTRTLSKAKVIAISPFLEGNPFSGPAGKLMMAKGLEPSSYGVAKLYSSFLKLMIVDTKEDASVINRIRGEGIECCKLNIFLRNAADRDSFSRDFFELL